LPKLLKSYNIKGGRGMSVKEQIWSYFLNKGFTPYGIAGIMGNL